MTPIMFAIYLVNKVIPVEYTDIFEFDIISGGCDYQ